MDGLVAAVRAGDFTAAAADALLAVKPGKDHRIPLQYIRRTAQGIQSQADSLLDTGKALLRQVQVQAFLQIVNDPVAVLHHGGSHLDRPAAQQDEFQGILPGLYAAHGGKVHPAQRRVLPQFGDKAQGDGPNGVPAVAAHGALTVHGRRRDEGVQVDAGDRFDGVNGGNAVRAAAFCRLGGGTHAGNVWRQLRQHRNMAGPFGCRGEFLHQLRHLADIRPQAALGHVRAGKVQLHRVRAVFLAQVRQFAPFRLVLAHDGGENELARILCLQAAEYLHVLGHAVVGKLLDILKAHDASAIAGDGGKTGRCLVDVHGTDGLEADPRPARLEGALAHIVGAGDHRGGEQKRVFKRNTAQLAL